MEKNVLLLVIVGRNKDRPNLVSTSVTRGRPNLRSHECLFHKRTLNLKRKQPKSFSEDIDVQDINIWAQFNLKTFLSQKTTEFTYN